MMDRVDVFVPDGGPAGLGFIQGSKHVRADEWFFKAHFYQDPVWPGSLGLEAMLQLMKVVAAERWGGDGAIRLQRRDAPLAVPRAGAADEPARHGPGERDGHRRRAAAA